MEREKPVAKKGLKTTIRKMLASKGTKSNDSTPKSVSKQTVSPQEPTNPTAVSEVTSTAKSTIANGVALKRIMEVSDGIPLGWKVEFESRSHAGKLIKRLKEQSTLKTKDQNNK